MRRAWAILYILFSFEVGICLFIFPWLSLWDNNFFVGHYRWVANLARNYFVRGAVSGIGLADMWLALYEVWRFPRKPKPVRK